MKELVSWVNIANNDDTCDLSNPKQLHYFITTINERFLKHYPQHKEYLSDLQFQADKTLQLIECEHSNRQFIELKASGEGWRDEIDNLSISFDR